MPVMRFLNFHQLRFTLRFDRFVLTDVGMIDSKKGLAEMMSGGDLQRSKNRQTENRDQKRHRTEFAGEPIITHP
jgi:hypothetical protein